MNSKTPYLTRPYENSLNHHFYLYLLSDTKYTRNHQKVNLGSPIGEGDDEGEQYNTGVEHHKQAPWLGATSTNTACWSILQISDFLDLVKTPQIVFWLFFFTNTLMKNKVWSLTYLIVIYLLPMTMYILLIPSYKVPGIKSILSFVWKIWAMSDESHESLYKMKQQTFW